MSVQLAREHLIVFAVGKVFEVVISYSEFCFPFDYTVFKSILVIKF